jgi:hypothetical protein
MTDAFVCAVCVVLLWAWSVDRRRHRARRRGWELRPGMPLEEELEVRRKALEDLAREIKGWNQK